MFLTCVGLLAILIYIESYALLAQVLSVWFPQPLAASGLALQAQLSEFLFNYSAMLMLAAIFLWILVVPITLVRPRNRVSALAPAKKTEKHDSRSIKTMSFSMLIAALVLAVFVPISPYLNRSSVQMLRGVDILYYYHVLLYTTSLAQLTGQIGANYSVLYLMLLYAIKATTRWDPIWAVVTGPVILAIIFTVAAYFLTNEVTENRVAAGIAALLGASSFHTTVGLYAGIFENWLGMTVALAFLLLLHQAIDKTKQNRSDIGCCYELRGSCDSCMDMGDHDLCNRCRCPS